MANKPTTSHWDAMTQPPGAKPPTNRQSRTHLEVQVVPGTEAPPSPGIVPPFRPEPQAAPPQPMSSAVLHVLKQVYNDWITAGGTPPLYGPVSPPAHISPPQ